MTNHPIHHVRQHATKHDEAHKNLKDLLKRPVYREKVWSIFFTTFLATLTTIIIFLSWGDIVNFFTPNGKAPNVQVHGYQTGALGSYKVDEMASDLDGKHLDKVTFQAQMTGLYTTQLVGDTPITRRPPEMNVILEGESQEGLFVKDAMKNSIWLTNMISTGQHLTKMDQQMAKSFQKSLLTTYYLGEKTIDINSTLQKDTQILTQINNALSVDLFQHLNQSSNRADTLNSYLGLLNALLEKTNERINDLQYKIDFLKGNSLNTENLITASEQAFFSNLEMFNGPNAEQQLGDFIGLQKEESEIKAKLGAYTNLQGYYVFFKPKLENLITAIKANRDPLIAGVKVVEIQNMTLPLIIRQN
ncbi:hypothetical protein JW758_02285 [Candidatus Peregrinibacteria bacterium]|nr:hypothetical protein [Candidatus Peregrinibacteria bacterium]